jgi:predicted chitinase
MDRAKFFARLRSALFGGRLSQGQVDGINAILDAWQARQMVDLRWLAYMLATAYHETGKTMEPVRETLAQSDDQAISRLENAYRSGRLPQVKTPYWRKDEDGHSWFGRGLVQLTFKRNYKAMSEALGLELLSDPSRAMEMGVSADILVVGMRDGMFSGRKLADYFNDKSTDWQNARRIINGMDRAKDIAAYGRTFHAVLLEAVA